MGLRDYAQWIPELTTQILRLRVRDFEDRVPYG